MVIDGEMPGSAPPRMPQATPPNAAGTIAVVNRLLRTSIMGASSYAEQFRPDAGGLRDMQHEHEQQPEEQRPCQSHDAELPAQSATLVISGHRDQGGEREDISEPVDEKHIDGADRQHAADAIELRAGDTHDPVVIAARGLCR